MASTGTWKRIISLLLALTLVSPLAIRVSAEEFSEPTEIPVELEACTEPEARESSEATEIPEITEPADADETPEAPEVPETPEVTAATEVPETTEATDVTEIPETTEATEASEIPETTEATEASEIPETTEATDVTEVPEATEPEIREEPAEGISAPALPIAEVLQMPAGTEQLTIAGTIVFASGSQAVLQDETGGIRMSFGSAPSIALGDILLVTGHRSGGFAVETYEKTGTGDLPALESTLSGDCGTVRILVKQAVLGENALSQNGWVCQMEGTVPAGLEIGDRVDAWGILLDGVFYADTLLLSENQEPEEAVTGHWNFYFGQLHAHTEISDGLGSVEEAFDHARQAENLDFFAVTDHSNSFDNAAQGALDTDGTAISQEWAAGKEAANAVTDETFVGIFGYEMTWPEDLAIGHINTFGTPGWVTRDQEGMDTLEGYLNALAAVPNAVSQFNHPGGAFGDFRNFSEYTPQYDALVHLLEVGSEGNSTAYDAYTTALDAGWHLAPSNNQNNHNGNWGSESSDRTVVLARELTEEAIYDAIRNYRVYATRDANLKIAYHLNNRIMGSTIGESETLTASIHLEDSSGDPIGLVEIVTENGAVAASAAMPESSGECVLEVDTGRSYYFLRLLRNEEIVAVTAPVWVDTYEDLGVGGFTADVQSPEQGTEAVLSLTIYNHETVPFVVDSVTFAIGEQILETITDPGSVESLGQLQVPLRYTQDAAGAVTITATVTGRIAGLARNYQEEIRLSFQPKQAELLPIGDVRKGVPGEAYRIQGYVTAGTSNPHNTFPGSIYLQDDSGGIEITDFTREGIQVGTPMEIEGVLRSVGGNLVLAMTDYELPDEDYYRYVPRTMAHETAMNYEAHGGELLQIEGHVVSITKTADGKGVSRFTIRDIVGDLATVIIEDSIGSGAYGTNELASEVKARRTVRAMGLLHIDEYGQTVLRVRNCDEVVYVPPRKDPSNPKTGDWLNFLFFRR